MNVLNQCKFEEKATDADVQGFLKHKIPQNRSGKCLMACVFEKNGDVMRSFSILKTFYDKRVCWFAMEACEAFIGTA